MKIILYYFILFFNLFVFFIIVSLFLRSLGIIWERLEDFFKKKKYKNIKSFFKKFYKRTKRK